MSPTPAVKRVAAPLEIGFTEQRSHLRYPVMLELEYKVLEGGRVKQLGRGRSLNISSGGVLFETPDIPETSARPKHNENIELMINWPFPLADSCALKLVIRGRVIRSDTARLAVKVRQHEFRTAGVAARSGRPTTASGDS